jgi:hypothetical protein
MTPVLTFPRDPERPPDGRVDEDSGRIVGNGKGTTQFPGTPNPDTKDSSRAIVLCQRGVMLLDSAPGPGHFFFGFISPTLVGWVTTQTGSLYYGLAAIGAVLILSALILLIGIPAKVIHERRMIE